MNAGIGNLVAEGNRKQIMSVFEELFLCSFSIHLYNVFWSVYVDSFIYNTLGG